MRNILVTGAGSGIGRATAELFHERGWSVGLTDVNETALADLARSLGDERVWWQALDVTDAGAARKACAAFAKLHDGYLQVLFNSAGVLRTGAFEKISPGAHRSLMEVNVIGMMNMCHGAFALLRKTPGATVINMSSASAMYGTPGFASYSASKFAVRGLTEALNIEWQAHDITVHDIMPPFVRTAMVESNPSPVMERMGVALTAEQVAQAVWDEANSDSTAVHRPVGLGFRMMMLVNKLAPSRLTREALRYLNR